MNLLFCSFVALLLLLSSVPHEAQVIQCGNIKTEVGSGTTLGLQSIYLGICFKFTHSQNCADSWTEFEKIILSKDPSDFTWHDFDPLFKVLNTSAEHGKSTFWAGTGRLVHRLSSINNHYVTLENTFPAAALDTLSFCPTTTAAKKDESKSSTQNTGNTASLTTMRFVDYTSSLSTISSSEEVQGRAFNMSACTNYIMATSNSKKAFSSSTAAPNAPSGTIYEFKDAFGAFWQAASMRFAREAVGKANIVFEVEDSGPTFCPGDFYGSIELPQIDKTKVSQVNVMIATNPRNPNEKCHSGSFVELQAMIQSHFADQPLFVFTCADDPYDLTLVRCAEKNRDDSYCQLLLQSYGSSSNAPSNACGPHCLSKTTFKFLLIGCCIAALLVGILLSVVVPLFMKCFRRSNSTFSDQGLSSSSYRVMEDHQSLINDAEQGIQP